MHRVLLTTTDPAFAAGLRATRSLAGCDVVAVDGVPEARRRLRAQAFDVVIGDPHTSLGDDLELLVDLRRIRPGVRLIALSPDTSPEAIIAALKLQAFACFSAPLDVIEIGSMARRAIDDAHGSDGIDVLSGVPNWISLRVHCRRRHRRAPRALHDRTAHRHAGARS